MAFIQVMDDIGRVGSVWLVFVDESSKTLCVKQLAYSISKEELKAAFKNAADVRMVADPDTGKPKG